MNEQLLTLIHIALAMLLAGIVGFDRELADKPAGLRTHMFVAGAAALLVNLGDVLVSDSGIPASLLRADPIRILEAIITGVSFLGAGTILRHREDKKIEGLTTAASLLFVAGIGAGVALRMYVISIGAAVLAILTLSGIKAIEGWLA